MRPTSCTGRVDFRHASTEAPPTTEGSTRPRSRRYLIVAVRVARKHTACMPDP